MLKIQLAKKLQSATVISAADYAARIRAKNDKAGADAAVKRQAQETLIALEALKNSASALISLNEQLVTTQSSEIAKLAVNIAEKVIARQIAAGQYDIEAIICDALANAGECQSVTVFVNPQDHAAIIKLQQENDSLINNVKLVPDSGLKRAECKIETGRGIIESLIDTKIRTIEKALAGLETVNETSNN